MSLALALQLGGARQHLERRFGSQAFQIRHELQHVAPHQYAIREESCTRRVEGEVVSRKRRVAQLAMRSAGSGQRDVETDAYSRGDRKADEEA